MLAPKLQAPLEDERTSVDPPRTRRVRPAAVRPERAGPEGEGGGDPPGYLGVRGDPGDRLAPARLTTVRMQAAIALRNHKIDAAERGPPRRPRPSLVNIDWVRSRDATQRIERIGPDTIRIRGLAAGRAGPRPGAQRSRPVTPLTPALSVAIDGLVHTVPVRIGGTPRAAAADLARRLCLRYRFEITDVSEDSAPPY